MNAQNKCVFRLVKMCLNCLKATACLPLKWFLKASTKNFCIISFKLSSSNQIKSKLSLLNIYERKS